MNMKILLRAVFPLLSMSLLFLGGPATGQSLIPTPIPAGAAAPVWEGPQFVEADRAGHVFFFRAETFEVYPVTKDGAFGKPVRLETAGDPPGFVHSAVLNRAGDQWLVYADLTVRRFVDGKEKPLPPLKWNPWAVGFVRDTPVVALIPRPLVRTPDSVTPPWLMELDAGDWSTLVPLAGPPLTQKALLQGALNDAIGAHAVYLTDDRQGRLWLAHQYAYHVQRLGPNGHPLLDLTVDGGEVLKKKEAPGIQMTMKGPADAAHGPGNQTGTFHAFTAISVIVDLTEGRDGRLYLLTRTAEAGTTLDRYDPVRGVLERLPLQLHTEGVMTMAAGRDALYLAAWNCAEGRWRIPWEALDEAHWKPVPGVKIDGFAADEGGTADELKPPAKGR
jgi:hypothetical protein